MERLKEKRQRHIANLSLFVGFLHGRFIDHGVPRPNKHKLKKSGTIFRRVK